MIRHFLLLLLALLLFGCNSEEVPDCIKSSGAPVSRVYDLQEFSAIVLESDLSLVVRQGDVQQVVVQSYANIIDDIRLTVADRTLNASSTLNCNLFRDYGLTTIYVTAPDLRLIRNSSSFDVRGEGVLAFQELRLQSNTSPGPGFPQKGGDFYLNLQCDQLSISANGQSVFYLNGNAEQASISFTDEFPRLEAAELTVGDLNIFQRSAAPMIVRPIQSIKGEIRGTGDIISYNRPPLVDVREFFTGRLIFVD